MKTIIFASISLFSSFAYSSNSLICKFDRVQHEYYVEDAFSIDLKKDLSTATQTTFDIYGKLVKTQTLRDNLKVVGKYKMDPSIGDRCTERLETVQTVNSKALQRITDCTIFSKNLDNTKTSRIISEYTTLYEGGGLTYQVYLQNQLRTDIHADCEDANTAHPPIPTIVMDIDVYTVFPNYSDYGCNLNGITETTFKRKDIKVPLSSAGPDSIQFSTDEFSSANCSLKDPRFPKVVKIDFGGTSGFNLTPDKFSQVESVNVSFNADRVGNKVVITSRCSWDLKCGQSGVEVRTGVQK